MFEKYGINTVSRVRAKANVATIENGESIVLNKRKFSAQEVSCEDIVSTVHLYSSVV